MLTYPDALRLFEEMYSRASSEKNTKQEADARLRRITSFCESIGAFGQLDSTFPRIYHVTGSKGKGSTTTFISHILQQKPRAEVGLFTSPHVESVRERIQINGELISKSHFAYYVRELLDIHRSLFTEDIRFFELLFTMAIGYFRSMGCSDIALEVGIGGHRDTTNALPLLEQGKTCVFTPIELEHVSILGDSVKEIAREKAGIIRSPSDKVVCSYENSVVSDVLEQLEERKRSVGCSSPIVVPSYTEVESLKNHLEGSLNAFVPLPLASNIVTAIAASGMARPTASEIRDLYAKRPLCRFRHHRISFDKHVGHGFFLDGAHTLNSLKHACIWFEATKENARENILVFNTTRDRDWRAHLRFVLQHSGPFSDIVLMPGSRSFDLLLNQAIDESQLSQCRDMQKKIVAEYPRQRVHLAESFSTLKGLLDAKNSPCNVFVTGSFLLCGYVYHELKQYLVEK